MDYYFEMVQKLKFSVYDIDNETSALGDDDFLGDMECNLGQVCKILLTHFTELISTEVNFHIDSVTPFHSTILLCQQSPPIINIQLHVLHKSK